MKEKLTHNELVKLGVKWLRNKKEGNIKIPNCSFILPEFYSSTLEIPDILGFSASKSVLIEVKTSLPDFKIDSLKPHRKEPETGMGQLRYFLCPEGLINSNDLPENWGLLYQLKDKSIEIVRYSELFECNLKNERAVLTSYISRLDRKTAKQNRVEEIIKQKGYNSLYEFSKEKGISAQRMQHWIKTTQPTKVMDEKIKLYLGVDKYIY